MFHVFSYQDIFPVIPIFQVPLLLKFYQIPVEVQLTIDINSEYCLLAVEPRQIPCTCVVACVGTL